MSRWEGLFPIWIRIRTRLSEGPGIDRHSGVGRTCGSGSLRHELNPFREVGDLHNGVRRYIVFNRCVLSDIRLSRCVLLRQLG